MTRLAAVLLGILLVWGHAPVLAGPWRADAGTVRGWALMSPAERIEHQRRLRSFTHEAECRAYLQAHHAGMAQRARDRGVQLAPGGRSPCDALLQRGALQ
ncbi:hypothetical protein [Zoogloea sp.]|uniref:hypothetical protein n=1 Tax=Zoogloea sp. TaxID=49181 RepID=UPI00262517AF|nr:hypothetical protein [Zoogloea sp.]MDD3353571.1 hypothetical protein [Zoogloea sp.]